MGLQVDPISTFGYLSAGSRQIKGSASLRMPAAKAMPAPLDTFTRQGAGQVIPLRPLAQPRFGESKGGLFKRLITAFENSQIYFPSKGVHLEKAPPDHLRSKIQDVTFQADDGTKLHGWYIPAKPDKETIVCAHGNAGTMARDFRVETMDAFVRRGFGYFAFDYRGFGKSEGKPSEQGLYKDLRAASKTLEKQFGVPLNQQVALGESLGGAVVAQVATELPFRTTFIYATFTSTPKLAAYLKTKRYVPKFIPVEKLFIYQKFESENKIHKIKSPLIIAHGMADELIPYHMSETLFKKATGSPFKVHVPVPKSDHNGVFPMAKEKLVDTLEHVLASTKPL